MVTKEEIIKLADLARIDIEEKEIENLRGEIEVILNYVGQVSTVAETEVDKEINDDMDIKTLHNIMREDENPTESGTYSKDLIAEFPDKEGDYLKVKKIL